VDQIGLNLVVFADCRSEMILTIAKPFLNLFYIVVFQTSPNSIFRHIQPIGLSQQPFHRRNIDGLLPIENAEDDSRRVQLLTDADVCGHYCDVGRVVDEAIGVGSDHDVDRDRHRLDGFFDQAVGGG
jgi:hypothetical protein